MVTLGMEVVSVSSSNSQQEKNILQNVKLILSESELLLQLRGQSDIIKRKTGTQSSGEKV